jgi:hypothetical protein
MDKEFEVQIKKTLTIKKKELKGKIEEANNNLLI